MIIVMMPANLVASSTINKYFPKYSLIPEIFSPMHFIKLEIHKSHSLLLLALNSNTACTSVNTSNTPSLSSIKDCLLLICNTSPLLIVSTCSSRRQRGITFIPIWSSLTRPPSCKVYQSSKVFPKKYKKI